MDTPSQKELFETFVFLCMALGLASMAFFFLSKNASLKRWLWPRFSAAFGVFVVGGLWLTAPHLTWPLYLFLVVVMLLNFRGMKFCDSCGKTVQSSNPFSPPKYCSKCGGRVA